MYIKKHSIILAISMLACSLAISGCASVDHTAEFFKIAEASCAKAQAVGVVEKSISKTGFTLVMVPKAQGYKDFSAAYFEPADKYELIYETDAFSACSASMSYEMSKEADKSTSMKVTYADGSYETTEDLGEYGISNIRYTVAEGLLAASETLDVAKADKRTITYGHLTKDDWAILTTAVDRYLVR
jgi:hypothetical protein